MPRRDGGVVSTSTAYSVFGGEFTGFQLDLLVTDGVGRTSSSNKTITIDPENMDLQCI